VLWERGFGQAQGYSWVHIRIINVPQQHEFH